MFVDSPLVEPFGAFPPAILFAEPDVAQQARIEAGQGQPGPGALAPAPGQGDEMVEGARQPAQR